MPRYRSRYWNGASGCEVRHSRGERIDDSKVKQISEFEWLVKSSDGDKDYSVTRQELSEEEDEEDHQENCEYCLPLGDDRFKKEESCESCGICWLFYSCNCPDDHEICKHVHKVHTMTKKLIEDQGPWTLEKTILIGLEKVEKLGKKIVYGQQDRKEQFAQRLFELLNNYQ